MFDDPSGVWTRAGAEQTFSNGYRYINWSIDVPMLLTQFLIALGLTGAFFQRVCW